MFQGFETNERIDITAVEGITWYDVINIGFAGAMTLVFLYAVSVYLYDRKSIYFYYALYIITIGIYLFSRSDFVAKHVFYGLYEWWPPSQNYIRYTFQYVAHFSALQFGLIFLNAKVDYPRLFKVAKYIKGIFLLAIILSIILIALWNDDQYNVTLVNVERVIASVATIYFQFLVLKNIKNRLVFFYMIGSIFFLVGALVSVAALDVIFMRIGTLMEILLFALGLAYRSKVIQEERNLFRDRMMEEVREKEVLLQQYNEDLKRQVLERSEALLKEQQLVEEEKRKVERLSLEKEIDLTKMTALRAQMKPHFLFNALNAIRALIIKEDPHKAYDYLTDFSKLVRYILESSENNFVSLTEELKLAHIYIRIEQMRLGENFDFQVNIADSIDADNLEIPPLIFQPFLENAILHAFDKDRKDQLLDLNIAIVDELVLIEVVDNGKGRQALKKAEREPQEHRSMATDLIRRRLNLMDFDGANLEIIDRLDEEGQALGTKVLISLPIVQHGKKVESINS